MQKRSRAVRLVLLICSDGARFQERVPQKKAKVRRLRAQAQRRFVGRKTMVWKTPALCATVRLK
jgi:hypothetical protein